MRNNLTADNLPLTVREYLMRGQQAQAIEQLTADYELSKAEAEALIETYREQLRERKLALEVQVMQAENAREEDERKHTILVWGVRIAVFVLILVALMLMLK